MSTSTFNDTQHPRTGDGRFAAKSTSEADGGLDALPARPAGEPAACGPQPDDEPGGHDHRADMETLLNAGVGAGAQHLLHPESRAKIAARVRAAGPEHGPDIAREKVASYHRFWDAARTGPVSESRASELADEAGTEMDAAREAFRAAQTNTDARRLEVAAADLQTCYARQLRADADLAVLTRRDLAPDAPEWWKWSVDQARTRIADPAYRGALHERQETA